MAVTRVSPGYPDAIRAVTEGSEYKFGAHPSGAWNPDDPYIGRVLKATHASQVSGAITAPVAEKGSNLWFPVIHSDLVIDSSSA